ncbi:MAG: hypothetical protein ACD_76C00085G0012 [uncultured bacterium]|nr:MAG: hypothetical protein ACD_76C00085G0012 [uncultured bacterium]
MNFAFWKRGVDVFNAKLLNCVEYIAFKRTYIRLGGFVDFLRGAGDFGWLYVNIFKNTHKLCRVFLRDIRGEFHCSRFEDKRVDIHVYVSKMNLALIGQNMVRPDFEIIKLRGIDFAHFSWLARIRLGRSQLFESIKNIFEVWVAWR